MRYGRRRLCFVACACGIPGRGISDESVSRRKTLERPSAVRGGGRWTQSSVPPVRVWPQKWARNRPGNDRASAVPARTPPKPY